MMVDYDINIKGRLSVKGKMSSERLSRFKKSWQALAYKQLHSCNDKEIRHNPFWVECFDKNWHLDKIMFYANCMMDDRQFEGVATMRNHLGYQNFIVGAFHR